MEEACQHDGFSAVARIEVARTVEVVLGEKPGVLPHK
jgi:hypothetical protein